MNCRKFQEWISLEIDDQLPPENVRSLQDHLQACDECREFREDLNVGLRMLHATDPELPENFDWKLQLKLSQTLRETARDAAYPWHEEERGWRRWLTRAGLSAAMGLAAVLAVAMLAPGQMPIGQGDRGGAAALVDRPLRLPVQTAASETPFADASRRPLESVAPFWSARGLQRSVSSGGAQLSWPDFGEHDLLRIRQLEQDMQVMRRRMVMKDLEIDKLQARLDSLTGGTVDTR
jgi:hypothetical protein